MTSPADPPADPPALKPAQSQTPGAPTPTPMSAPTVSIVMATYNRSNIIGHSIQSVRQGHFQDWELIVVGDACTDDTAEVVAGFGDPRIRFINRAHNFGEQSGPNNTGVALATGEYLAFINHDDLWLPDHLARSVRRLQETGADMIFGQGLAPSPHDHRHALNGALCDAPRPFDPAMSVPASLWVMRRELALRIGPWRAAREISAPPSQEWLYRAHRAGASLLADPVLSVVLVQSGARKNAYRDRQADENTYWAGKLQDTHFLLGVLSTLHGQALHERDFSPGLNLARAFKSLLRRILLASGIWPPGPKYWLRYARKGAFLRELRRRRGLESSLPHIDEISPDKRR